jgi:ATP synthase protein I
MAKATPPSNPKNLRPSSSFLKYSSLGLQMLFTIGFAGVFGYWIDYELSLKFPAFLLGFILIAFAGTIYKLYRELDK